MKIVSEAQGYQEHRRFLKKKIQELQREVSNNQKFDNTYGTTVGGWMISLYQRQLNNFKKQS